MQVFLFPDSRKTVHRDIADIGKHFCSAVLLFWENKQLRRCVDKRCVILYSSGIFHALPRFQETEYWS